jgi:hypothetical protein
MFCNPPQPIRLFCSPTAKTFSPPGGCDTIFRLDKHQLVVDFLSKQFE